MSEQFQLYCGDCLETLPTLAAGSVDTIIADLPYGTTACDWDSVIPLEPLWKEFERVTKPMGAIALFGSQPFTTKLIHSNLDWFKYCLYWQKTKPNGWQHAKNKPMRAIEEIAIFSSGVIGHQSLTDNRMTYNPQGVVSAGKNTIKSWTHGRTMGKRPNQVGRQYESFTGYPCDVLNYSNINGDQAIHPTQKPVDLLKYLLLTYTNEGETVLDCTMGSGTTGVAALQTGRRFVGIELDKGYFEIARKRITDAARAADGLPKQLAGRTEDYSGLGLFAEYA